MAESPEQLTASSNRLNSPYNYPASLLNFMSLRGNLYNSRHDSVDGFQASHSPADAEKFSVFPAYELERLRECLNQSHSAGSGYRQAACFLSVGGSDE